MQDLNAEQLGISDLKLHVKSFTMQFKKGLF